MYSDLFDQLGAGGPGGGGGRNRGGNGNNGGGSDGEGNQPAPLVSFKAGRINLLPNSNSDTEDADYEYSCRADEKRGEVRMVWKDSALQWQWYDRRNKRVAETVPVPDSGSTFERVPLEHSKKHKGDRIYVWTKGVGEYSMYWMQDASDENEDETIAKVNQYLADPQSAAPAGGGNAGGSSAMDTDRDGNANSASGPSASGISSTAGSSGEPGASGTNQSQVDALSSILENLGMPQSGGPGGGAGVSFGSPMGEGSGASGVSGRRSGSGVPSSSSGGGGAAGTLTLADLQGAMAGIQAAQAPATAASGPPLQEVVTPGAISNLLENDDVRERLLGLLPEEQRTTELLEDNLRSPQVQQTLRTLTAALVPDDAGNMDGFYSVLANFGLDPADGQAAMTSVNPNPIQAFLDCVLASVEKEKQQEQGEEKSEENQDQKDESKE